MSADETVVTPVEVDVPADVVETPVVTEEVATPVVEEVVAPKSKKSSVMKKLEVAEEVIVAAAVGAIGGAYAAINTPAEKAAILEAFGIDLDALADNVVFNTIEEIPALVHTFIGENSALTEINALYHEVISDSEHLVTVVFDGVKELALKFKTK